MKTISDCLDGFVDSLFKHQEFATKDSIIANKHFEKHREWIVELNGHGEQGLSALATLLDDGRDLVRVNAAHALIMHRTEASVKVLKEASKSSDWWAASLAMVTLKRWEMGYYIDPVTGKEVKTKKEPGENQRKSE